MKALRRLLRRMNVRQIGSRGADFFRTGNGRAQRCSGEAVYVLRVTGIRHAGLPRSRVTRFQCRLTSVLEQNHFSFKDIDKLTFLTP
jgi:hypothetical protein